MELLDAMQKRHSVRQYAATPIEREALRALREEIELCNREGGSAYSARHRRAARL